MTQPTLCSTTRTSTTILHLFVVDTVVLRFHARAAVDVTVAAAPSAPLATACRHARATTSYYIVDFFPTGLHTNFVPYSLSITQDNYSHKGCLFDNVLIARLFRENAI